MSTNRRETPISTINFSTFLARCEEEPVVRCWGKQEAPTKAKGRLVRFNRLVEVDIESVKVAARTGEPFVKARRVRWDKKLGCWQFNGPVVTLSYRLLDYVSWDDGTPNWEKVAN